MSRGFLPGCLALSMMLLLATGCAAERAPGDPPVAARIDGLISPQAEAGLFSGVILVARADQILVHRAHGFANWELGVPNSPRSGSASLRLRSR
jgi:CubicO group peptidase (beta-lactamase class C family)